VFIQDGAWQALLRQAIVCEPIGNQTGPRANGGR
jgi:hypothetical protein